MLVGGFFFATLAMAAAEAQLPMEVLTGCVADEQLFPVTDELQGLHLLQVEVGLQSEAPVASHTVVPKVMPSYAATPKRFEVEIQAAPMSAAGVDNEGKILESAKSSSTRATPSDLGLRNISTETSLFDRSVAGMTLRGGSTIFIVMVLLVLVFMCVIMGLARQGSPVAQAILQAPQMMNQQQSPPVASLNKSPTAPVSNPAISETGKVLQHMEDELSMAAKVLNPLSCFATVADRVCTIMTLLVTTITLGLHPFHDYIGANNLALVGGVNAAIVCFIKGVELHCSFAARASMLQKALAETKKLKIALAQAVISESHGTLPDVKFEGIRRDFEQLLEILSNFVGVALPDASDEES